MNCGARPRAWTSRSSVATVSVDAPVALHCQRLPGELVDDVQQLEDPPVSGLVELEVQRPHVIGALCSQPARRHRRGAQALALAAPLRDSQAFLAPQPLCALAIQRPAVVEQQLVRATVAPPGPLSGDLAQARTQRRVIRRDARLATLRRAMLTRDLTRPPLRHTKTIHKHQDRLAPARRAHQFPFAISFSPSISTSLFATIRFNVTFSRSSSFKRFTSSAFIPPYCARHR
jgi:hypothetical protein